MKNTELAFKWIVQLLQDLHIPFHITGGFAARVYGSTRELADIDIDIPEGAFTELIPHVKDYIVYGPRQYTDSSWDLLLMTLNYQGQAIDISGAYTARIFDQNIKEWVSAQTNFSDDTTQEVFGTIVPVMSRNELITYKSKLRRDVDLEDVKALRQ